MDIIKGEQERGGRERRSAAVVSVDLGERDGLVRAEEELELRFEERPGHVEDPEILLIGGGPTDAMIAEHQEAGAKAGARQVVET